jgi:hypothetical protein
MAALDEFGLDQQMQYAIFTEQDAVDMKRYIALKDKQSKEGLTDAEKPEFDEQLDKLFRRIADHTKALKTSKEDLIARQRDAERAAQDEMEELKTIIHNDNYRNLSEIERLKDKLEEQEKKGGGFKIPDMKKPPPSMGQNTEGTLGQRRERKWTKPEQLGQNMEGQGKDQSFDSEFPDLGQDQTPKFLDKFMVNTYKMMDQAKTKTERDDALTNLRKMDTNIFHANWYDEVTDRISDVERRLNQSTSDMLYASESGGNRRQNFIRAPPNGIWGGLSAFGEKVWKSLTERIRYNSPDDKTINLRDLLRKVTAFAIEANIDHTCFLGLLERLCPIGPIKEMIELYLETDGELDEFFVMIQSGLDDREAPLAVKNQLTRLVNTMQKVPLPNTLMKCQQLAMKQHRMDSPNFRKASIISTAQHAMETYCYNYYNNAQVKKAIGTHGTAVDRLLTIGDIKSLPSLLTLTALHEILVKNFAEIVPSPQSPPPMWLLENVGKRREHRQDENGSRDARPKPKLPANQHRRYLGQAQAVQPIRTRSENGILEFLEDDEPYYEDQSYYVQDRGQDEAEEYDDNVSNAETLGDWQGVTDNSEEPKVVAQMQGQMGGEPRPQFGKPAGQMTGTRPKLFAPPPQHGNRPNMPVKPKTEACFLCNAKGKELHYARNCHFFPNERIQFNDPVQACCGGRHLERRPNECPRARYLKRQAQQAPQ